MYGTLWFSLGNSKYEWLKLRFLKCRRLGWFKSVDVSTYRELKEVSKATGSGKSNHSLCHISLDAYTAFYSSSTAMQRSSSMISLID